MKRWAMCTRSWVARLGVALLSVCLLGLAPTAALAATFTVGPGGTDRTIQAAINAAVVMPGRNEVRVAAGQWHERIAIRSLPPDGSLIVTGGWDPSFTRRPDPTSPVAKSSLDVDGLAPVVTITQSLRGLTVFKGFNVTGGQRQLRGEAVAACIVIAVAGEARVQLEANLIHDNRVVSTSTMSGGAMQVTLKDQAQVRIERNVIRDNQLRAPGGNAGALSVDAAGASQLWLGDNHFTGNGVVARDNDGGPARNGAAEVVVRDTARAFVSNNHFRQNQVVSAGEARTAALGLLVRDAATGELTGNVFEGNRASSRAGRAFAVISLAALAGPGSGRPRLVARRNTVRRNLVANLRGQQVDLAARAGELSLTDSLVVDGTGQAIVAAASELGVIHLTNLTVANHTIGGLLVTPSDAPGAVYLSNSIVFHNDIEVAGPVLQVANFFDDPLFVNAAAGDYHLQLGSLAINAGDNTAPGGLGATDLGDARRVQSGTVDLGASETPARASPLALGCRVREAAAASNSAPPDTDSNTCTCAVDLGLNGFRCGFFHPDFMLVLRGPTHWEPGGDIGINWSIQPWREVAGPFAMTTEALIDGSWVAQIQLGPAAAPPEPDKVVVTTFRLHLPASGRTVVRTAIEYKRPGTGGPNRAVLEVLMPDSGPQSPRTAAPAAGAPIAARDRPAGKPPCPAPPAELKTQPRDTG